MTETKKSIVEEAMADYKLIQEALEANTKEILRGVAREEIDGVVKESINEDMYDETEVEDDETDVDDLDSTEDDSEGDTDLDVSVDDELPADDLDQEVGELDLDATGSDDYDAESGEDYEFDLTGASDEDVISVYKKLANNDEIEVVSPNEVTIKDPVSGSEYSVKFGKGSPTLAPVLPPVTSDLDLDDELGSDDLDLDTTEEDLPVGDKTEEDLPIGDEDDEDELGESTIFEIAMANEDCDDEDVDYTMGSKDPNQLPNPAKELHIESEEIEESIPGKATSIKGPGAKLEQANQRYIDLLAETKKKDVEIEDFKKALNKFRHMLGETAVFNQNLTYVTKLFLENSTTATEKETILERFDNATTISESKTLYKTIAKELGSKTPIKETVESKINKEASSGTTGRLNESTAYESPELSRFKDLMNKMENRINN